MRQLPNAPENAAQGNPRLHIQSLEMRKPPNNPNLLHITRQVAGVMEKYFTRDVQGTRTIRIGL